MSDELPPEPVETLGYFANEEAGTSSVMSRLLLIAGVICALAEAAQTLAFTYRGMGFGGGNRIDDFLIGAQWVQLLVAVAVVCLAVLVLMSGVGTMPLIFGEAALVVVKASTAALSVASVSRVLHKGNTPHSFINSIYAQSTCGFIETSLVPVLIIVLLLRKDRMTWEMRKAGTSTPSDQ